MNQLLTPGQTAYKDFGPLHIRIDCHDEGVTITVTHHDILNRQFTNLVEGRQYLALLRDHATAGTPMWLIEAAAGAWTSAAAVVDDAEQAMVDGINATMDAAQPESVDVSDIVDDMPAGGSWAALRRNIRNDYSRTRVSSQPPTEAELYAISRHTVDGRGYLIVQAQPGQSWTVLKALHARIGGIVTHRPGTRKIASLTFRSEQLAGYLNEERAA